nr:hypothetical protein CFP56_46763 [Quercus suber]
MVDCTGNIWWFRFATGGRCAMTCGSTCGSMYGTLGFSYDTALGGRLTWANGYGGITARVRPLTLMPPASHMRGSTGRFVMDLTKGKEILSLMSRIDVLCATFLLGRMKGCAERLPMVVAPS